MNDRPKQVVHVVRSEIKELINRDDANERLYRLAVFFNGTYKTFYCRRNQPHYNPWAGLKTLAIQSIPAIDSSPLASELLEESFLASLNGDGMAGTKNQWQRCYGFV